jgi:hypothetical protein
MCHRVGVENFCAGCGALGIRNLRGVVSVIACLRQLAGDVVT